MNDPILPVIELDWDFLPVLVICKNEADLKKIEAATVMTNSPNAKSIGKKKKKTGGLFYWPF